MTQPQQEAFWSRVERAGADQCWMWKGSRNRTGYGLFTFSGCRWVASRYALALKLGRELKPRMFACHTCDNPGCVNPAHLWEGTCQDNMRDAAAKKRTTNARKTHCNKGHPFSGENLSFVKDGSRKCLACHRQRNRLWHPKRPSRSKLKPTEDNHV